MCRIHIKNAEIITRRTIHDGGEPWKNDPHETFLVKMGNEAFLCPETVSLSVERCDSISSRYAYHIDIAFVNLYQLGSESGMGDIHALDADRIVLYHLPAQEDDTCHYWMIGMQAVERFTGTYQGRSRNCRTYGMDRCSSRTARETWCVILVSAS
ncbi:MAG: hypothetical protein ACLUD0_06245 [Eubacterium ramulus]